MDFVLPALRKICTEEQKSKSGPSEEQIFDKLYSEWKYNGDEGRRLSLSKIRWSYSSMANEPSESMRRKLRDIARSEFLLFQEKLLLNNEELRDLCLSLDKMMIRDGKQGNSQSLQYHELKKVIEGSEKLEEYFKPSVVAQLMKKPGPRVRIAVVDILNYVMRKTWLVQSRIGLNLYDSQGNGYLSEEDLENYFSELIPTLPQLDQLDKKFYPFYVTSAVRKFLFFLDPSKTRRIKIQDILISTFLDDILDLKEENLPKEYQESNWFSAQTALRIYSQYVNLDTDSNGMLSKKEFSRYGSGTLTEVFIDRIYQVCQSYEEELDYNTYIDLVLALENRSEPQSLQYLFRILDINECGYLDIFSLNYFFKSIMAQIKDFGQEPVTFEDVKDEIFDMIKPADPTKITLQDLIRCGQGEVVINILVDLNGVYSY